MPPKVDRYWPLLFVAYAAILLFTALDASMGWFHHFTCAATILCGTVAVADTGLVGFWARRLMTPFLAASLAFIVTNLIHNGHPWDTVARSTARSLVLIALGIKATIESEEQCRTLN